MPKVSIILPVYNGECYLQQSVNSIISQTFTDWELIIVDDCSTDSTALIANQYAGSDSRIHVIYNKENQKLPKSLNIGFSKAAGKYLTWSSDDNLYFPDAIIEMAGYLDLHPEIAMVRCDMQIINNKGEITGLSGTYTDEKIYSYNCLGACFLYRREVREQIGDYDADTFCVEDYDYWLRVLGHFGKIKSIDKVLYQYRRHENSLSELRKTEVLNQLTKLRIRYLDEIFDALNQNKEELCRIYYEMKRSPYMVPNVMDKFKQFVPELCGEISFSTEKKYLIFGAGKYGEKAAIQLGSQAFAFTDSNPEKAGKIKCGLKILSFQDAVSLAEDYIFLIAAAGECIYEMMRQLQNAGIKKYSVFIAFYRQ